MAEDPRATHLPPQPSAVLPGRMLTFSGIINWRDQDWGLWRGLWRVNQAEGRAAEDGGGRDPGAGSASREAGPHATPGVSWYLRQWVIFDA